MDHHIAIGLRLTTRKILNFIVLGSTPTAADMQSTPTNSDPRSQLVYHEGSQHRRKKHSRQIKHVEISKIF